MVYIILLLQNQKLVKTGNYILNELVNIEMEIAEGQKITQECYMQVF